MQLQRQFCSHRISSMAGDGPVPAQLGHRCTVIVLKIVTHLLWEHTPNAIICVGTSRSYPYCLITHYVLLVTTYVPVGIVRLLHMAEVEPLSYNLVASCCGADVWELISGVDFFRLSSVQKG